MVKCIVTPVLDRSLIVAQDLICTMSDVLMRTVTRFSNKEGGPVVTLMSYTAQTFLHLHEYIDGVWTAASSAGKRHPQQ